MKLMSVYKEYFTWNYLEWLKTLKWSHQTEFGKAILGCRFQIETFESLRTLICLDLLEKSEKLKNDFITLKVSSGTNVKV